MAKIGQIKQSELNGVSGFIDYEIVKNKPNYSYKKSFKNTITNAGNQLMGSMGFGDILNNNASLYGQQIAYSGLYGIASNANAIHYRQDSSLTNVLLNLPESARSSFGASTNFVDIYNDTLTGIDTTKVIGYGKNNIVPTGDGFEATIDQCKPEYFIQPNAQSTRWKYPENIATGSFNLVGMMPCNSLTPGNASVGFSVHKLLDPVNTQYQNFVSLSTSFLPPGVTGYTSDTEIILDCKQDSFVGCKIDLSTGVVTWLTSTDNFATLKSILPTTVSNSTPIVQDYRISGTILSVLFKAGSTVYAYSFDMANGLSQVSTANATSNSSCNFSFFDLNGAVYICASTVGATYAYSVFKTTLNASGYITGITRQTGDITTIDGVGGLTLDSNYYYALGTYKPGVYTLKVTKPSEMTSNLWFFTDPSNIRASIIGVAPFGYTRSANGGSPSFAIHSAIGGFITFGYFANSLVNDISNSYTMYYKWRRNIINNSNSSTTSYLPFDTSDGAAYCFDGSWGNIISGVALDSAETKGQNDILFVSYGYKTVQG